MNGVFAVAKPSGPTSADVVQTLKRLFTRSPEYLAELKARSPQQNQKRRKKPPWIKIGHGGTLDPMADGVLVIGVGKGTKQLQSYLGNCSKTYTATALLGASTTTYDSQGSVLEYAPVEHVTQESIEKVLDQFRGQIKQLPPVFSALKMDGKPLYEYAREGKSLPRPIEHRECEVTLLKVGNVSQDQKMYELPEKEATDAERTFASEVVNRPLELGTRPNGPMSTLELTFSVSSGTYIRSLIHDIGVALGTRAHMVKLTRQTQGEWVLGRNTIPASVFEGDHEEWWPKLQTSLNEGPKQAV